MKRCSFGHLAIGLWGYRTDRLGVGPDNQNSMISHKITLSWITRLYQKFSTKGPITTVIRLRFDYNESDQNCDLTAI